MNFSERLNELKLFKEKLKSRSNMIPSLKGIKGFWKEEGNQEAEEQISWEVSPAAVKAACSEKKQTFPGHIVE